MPKKVKYYKALEGIQAKDASEILRQEFPGVEFRFCKPGFCAWGSLTLDVPQKKYSAIINRLTEAGMVFERRKPHGAF